MAAVGLRIASVEGRLTSHAGGKNEVAEARMQPFEPTTCFLGACGSWSSAGRASTHPGNTDVPACQGNKLNLYNTRGTLMFFYRITE